MSRPVCLWNSLEACLKDPKKDPKGTSHSLYDCIAVLVSETKRMMQFRMFFDVFAYRVYRDI